jgi:hypothetical protein
MPRSDIYRQTDISIRINKKNLIISLSQFFLNLVVVVQQPLKMKN